MNYIVFDLEWNQSPQGKNHSDQRLPFEIIEIGAIRLDENFKNRSSFHCLIKPKVYQKINNNIHNVIHIDIKDLLKGLPFPEAVCRFLSWCGDDFCLCSWGNQDVFELERNMDYYHLLHLLPAPILYADVQKLFAISSGEPSERRSLEYAVDVMGLSKQKSFHRALNDAYYTARVLQLLPKDLITRYPSLDIYRHPEGEEEDLFLYLSSCSKYVSHPFPSRERAMKNPEVTSTRCPVCRASVRRQLRWFSLNAKVYYSISLCPNHGLITGKIRFHHTKDDTYFAVKTLRLGDEAAAADIRKRRQAFRLKAAKL